MEDLTGIQSRLGGLRTSQGPGSGRTLGTTRTTRPKRTTTRSRTMASTVVSDSSDSRVSYASSTPWEVEVEREEEEGTVISFHDKSTSSRSSSSSRHSQATGSVSSHQGPTDEEQSRSSLSVSEQLSQSSSQRRPRGSRGRWGRFMTLPSFHSTSTGKGGRSSPLEDTTPTTVAAEADGEVDVDMLSGTPMQRTPSLSFLPPTDYDEYRSIASEDDRQLRRAREERIQQLIQQYSNRKTVVIEEDHYFYCDHPSHPHKVKDHEEDIVSILDDHQSIIERGEEVTYGDFLIDKDGTGTTTRQTTASSSLSYLPKFQRFFSKRNNVVNSTTTPTRSESTRCESDEEPCNYDYYFSNPHYFNDHDRMNPEEWRLKRLDFTNPMHTRMMLSSPDRSTGMSSSDGSYSSEGSPPAMDPLNCTIQDEGIGYGCGGGASSSRLMIVRTATEENTARDQEEEDYDDDDAYCSFFPTSGTLPSINEEAGPETTLCNWTDVEYYSQLCAAHSDRVLHRPSSQHWRWQCPSDPDAWRDVTLLPPTMLNMMMHSCPNGATRTRQVISEDSPRQASILVVESNGSM